MGQEEEEQTPLLVGQRGQKARGWLSYYAIVI